MLLTFVDDLEVVVARKVGEPFACNVLEVMGFDDLEPAIIDLS